MQMQHARDLQRGVGGGTNSGNNANAGGLAAAINPNNISGLPAIMGASGEIKPHQCQQCLKSFSSNHQLVQHIRVHTGEKPYKCSYCDRRFKQLSHVQQHTRLHTGKHDLFGYILNWLIFIQIIEWEVEQEKRRKRRRKKKRKKKKKDWRRFKRLALAFTTFIVHSTKN